jgi:hypothetical protein
VGHHRVLLQDWFVLAFLLPLISPSTFTHLSRLSRPTDATLKLNGRSFKVLRLLGEGGFSYVRLHSASPPPPTSEPEHSNPSLRRCTSPRTKPAVASSL